MALPVYITTILVLPCFFLFVYSFEIPPIDKLAETELVEQPHLQQKRYPDHFNAGIKFFFNVGECPESGDGIKKFYCSSSMRNGKLVCIDDHQLCNGVKECPDAEDENPKNCLFFRAVRSQITELERSVQNLMRVDMRSSKSRRYSHGISHHDDY